MTEHKPTVVIWVQGGVADYLATDDVDVHLVDYDNEPDAPDALFDVNTQEITPEFEAYIAKYDPDSTEEQ